MTSGHDSQHHPNRVVIRSIAYGSQISPRIRYRRMILRVHTILRLLRACFEIFESRLPIAPARISSEKSVLETDIVHLWLRAQILSDTLGGNGGDQPRNMALRVVQVPHGQRLQLKI